MSRYRITLRPLQGHPFSEAVIVDSSAPPRFEGPVVIIATPRDAYPNGPGPHPSDRIPLLMAWPLAAVSAVIVDEFDDDR